MKILIIVLCSLSYSLFASTDRDVFTFKAQGPKLSKTRFKAVISILNRHFESYAQRDGRELEFYTDYDADWAQAFARRWETDQVHVYGGLAAVPGVTEDSFALVLCHELGHLYGGEPFGDAYNHMAVEGQADYWATLSCFKEVVDDLPPLRPSSIALSLCEQDERCARGMDASLVMSSFFADNRSIAHPQFHTPDLSVVTEVVRTHPEPQCRLDTYQAGLLHKERPACWMPRGALHGRISHRSFDY